MVFVYHFVDRKQRVEIIFRREGTEENREIDFKIGDVGISVHWY